MEGPLVDCGPVPHCPHQPPSQGGGCGGILCTCHFSGPGCGHHNLRESKLLSSAQQARCPRPQLSCDHRADPPDPLTVHLQAAPPHLCPRSGHFFPDSDSSLSRVPGLQRWDVPWAPQTGTLGHHHTQPLSRPAFPRPLNDSCHLGIFPGSLLPLPHL